MKVGFTGTHFGMTLEQMRSVFAILQKLKGEWFKHGDCVGADCEGHYLAMSLGLLTMIHPPLNRARRAWCNGDVVRDEDEYLMRNKIIVLESDVMIACPKSMHNWTGGTWWTIRYAIKMEKPIYIIKPDGTL